MKIPVTLAERNYDITLERGALKKAGEILDLKRKVLIVTDSEVPFEYLETVRRACKQPVTATVKTGEASKSLENFEKLCRLMLKEGFTRKDCVVALGGGVIGDLAGFAAACYMRGIDFYNIPTTLLSQVDSSVGGKTAIDLGGIKNIVGAFYQPKGVLIDPEVLQTLDREQFACGAAEIIKMAATFDKELFRLIQKSGIESQLDEVIAGALKIKAQVVAKDEREGGLRKALNFGHTIGHGIESVTAMLHGQCVALGMLPMTSPELRETLAAVLIENGLPVAWSTCTKDKMNVIDAVMHDKKAESGGVVTVHVDKIGDFNFVKMNKLQLIAAYEEVWG